MGSSSIFSPRTPKFDRSSLENQFFFVMDLLKETELDTILQIHYSLLKTLPQDDPAKGWCYLTAASALYGHQNFKLCLNMLDSAITLLRNNELLMAVAWRLKSMAFNEIDNSPDRALDAILKANAYAIFPNNYSHLFSYTELFVDDDVWYATVLKLNGSHDAAWLMLNDNHGKDAHEFIFGTKKMLTDRRTAADDNLLFLSKCNTSLVSHCVLVAKSYMWLGNSKTEELDLDLALYYFIKAYDILDNHRDERDPTQSNLYLEYF